MMKIILGINSWPSMSGVTSCPDKPMVKVEEGSLLHSRDTSQKEEKVSTQPIFTRLPGADMSIAIK
jgi:hypothetical protein